MFTTTQTGFAGPRPGFFTSDDKQGTYHNGSCNKWTPTMEKNTGTLSFKDNKQKSGGNEISSKTLLVLVILKSFTRFWRSSPETRKFRTIWFSVPQLTSVDQREKKAYTPGDFKKSTLLRRGKKWKCSESNSELNETCKNSSRRTPGLFCWFLFLFCGLPAEAVILNLFNNQNCRESTIFH